MSINRNIGLIGLGYWGKNILRNLFELNLLHTACDSSRDIIKERSKSFPGVNYTQDIDKILCDPGVKAVVISTPACTHYELAKKCLNAKKDVFVEKPLALRSDEGKELVELAERSGKILMVGHILQYHPAVIKLKEFIRNGDLGKVQYIYSNRLNLGKLRVEENILWSFAPHDISVILDLVDDIPVNVGCFGEGYLNEDIFDITLTKLEFKNRVKAHIFVSWLHPYKEQKLVVVGSKAMALFDDQTAEKLFIYPHTIQWKEGKIPVAQKADYYCPALEQKEPLKEELLHFAECVLERRTPRTDGQEGLRVLNVLEQAEMNMVRKEVLI